MRTTVLVETVPCPHRAAKDVVHPVDVEVWFDPILLAFGFVLKCRRCSFTTVPIVKVSEKKL